MSRLVAGICCRSGEVYTACCCANKLVREGDSGEEALSLASNVGEGGALEGGDAVEVVDNADAEDTGLLLGIAL